MCDFAAALAVSSHRLCSLSSPEFIKLPKTKPHPSPDLSSVGLLKFYLVGAVVRTGMMAEIRGSIVVTAELVLAATNAGTNGLGAYGVRVIADLVNKVFKERTSDFIGKGSFSEGINSCLGGIDSHDFGLKENVILGLQSRFSHCDSGFHRGQGPCFNVSILVKHESIQFSTEKNSKVFRAYRIDPETPRIDSYPSKDEVSLPGL
ncbi:hypothetical protein PIB30_066201 [Stylosanthes scabra]|uniref:Uncharacterized protein n=1 Tax=Stylosanthes scabra TaxID=79078 RepID=A0ABU6VKJ7_9FABA|nr:hypothetical protein [Stylosanthes scabra]